MRETPRRADAIANRTALLDAAATLLVRDGYGVSLEAIAREAGVGIGTLYRNFADREQLYAAVVLRAYELVARLAQAAEDAPGAPLDALATFFAQLVEERDRLALPLLGALGPARGHINPLGQQITRSLTAVLRRGIADGSIRPDASATDLIVAGAMLAHAQLPADAWRAAASRIAGILLDGLRTRPDATSLPPALTRTQLDQATAQQAAARPASADLP
jgi:AcrR family transcriptional regulator